MSTRRWFKTLLGAFGAVMLLAAAPPPAYHATGPDQVTIAILDQFPDSLIPDNQAGPFVAAILRRPGENDVIVLNPDFATAESLASAVIGLRQARQEFTAPARAMTGLVKSVDPVIGRPLVALREIVDQLGDRPKSAKDDLGYGRWMDVPAARLGL